MPAPTRTCAPPFRTSVQSNLENVVVHRSNMEPDSIVYVFAGDPTKLGLPCVMTSAAFLATHEPFFKVADVTMNMFPPLSSGRVVSVWPPRSTVPFEKPTRPLL